MTYQIEISAEEEKALAWGLVNIQSWLENAIKTKAQRCIDQLIELKTDKRAAALTMATKEQLINSFTIETAAEKKEREESYGF